MKTENAEQNISEFFVERVQLFDSSLLGEAGQGMAVAGLQNTDFSFQFWFVKLCHICIWRGLISPLHGAVNSFQEN